MRAGYSLFMLFMVFLSRPFRGGSTTTLVAIFTLFMALATSSFMNFILVILFRILFLFAEAIEYSFSSIPITLSTLDARYMPMVPAPQYRSSSTSSSRGWRYSRALSYSFWVKYLFTWKKLSFSIMYLYLSMLVVMYVFPFNIW